MALTIFSNALEVECDPLDKFMLICLADSAGDWYDNEVSASLIARLTCMSDLQIGNALHSLKVGNFLEEFAWRFDKKVLRYSFGDTIHGLGTRVTDRDLSSSRIRLPGYVYLIQSPTGIYKIGRTKNPKDRMKTFQVKLPFEVEYTCVIKTNDMRGLERELHQLFQSKRVGGEWFNLSDQEVNYIKALSGAGDEV